MEEIISWLKYHSQPCFYKEFFGFECPGCGTQRAFIELLRGNIYDSFLLYPPLIPILILFIFFILHIIFRIKKGEIILKIMLKIVIAIIFISWLIKSLILPQTCSS